jgi:GrpB-like predicted nucleotidyltransferase (UPF0157 family)
MATDEPHGAGLIPIVDYDPHWPELFLREADRIRAALGPRVLGLEHTGSTSVPGLAAKPIIDMTLAVEWYEHRMFKGPDTDVNLHVFPSGCPEIARILRFRDWLRTHAADRDLYARTKLALSRQKWKTVDDYADAKTAVITAVIQEILGRARLTQV